MSILPLLNFIWVRFEYQFLRFHSLSDYATASDLMNTHDVNRWQDSSPLHNCKVFQKLFWWCQMNQHCGKNFRAGEEKKFLNLSFCRRASAKTFFRTRINDFEHLAVFSVVCDGLSPKLLKKWKILPTSKAENWSSVSYVYPFFINWKLGRESQVT